MERKLVEEIVLREVECLNTIPPQGHMSRADLKAYMYSGFSFSAEHSLRIECVGHYVLISCFSINPFDGLSIAYRKAFKSHESECEYKSFC